MRRIIVLCALVAGVVGAVGATAKETDAGFPYRSQYLDATVIETPELAKRFSQVVIVDVRSQYEFETLSIKDAVNIPLHNRDFVDAVRKLREQSNKPIVFYCNGRTCRKSYDAALLAIASRIDNTLAYDAGVFDWAKAHPERTVLLGKNPIGPDDLIDGDRFKARLLAPKDFEAKIGTSAIVLDVRDRVQRDTPLFPFKEQRAQLDNKARLDAIVDQAKREQKTLLIYDAVGKQVQWLQYHLEARGLKDYYFMKGGAQAYWDSTLGKVTLGKDKKKEKAD